MNDDLTPLASAYLDGDVTPAERAQVEGSAELTTEVERLRQVRSVIGADEPPAISMRERHLAAALDAWDRLPDVERIAAVRDQTPAGVDPAAAAAASTVSAPPTSLAARRNARNRTWMMAAAAGLIVVLGGGIILTSLNGGDNNDTADDAPLGAVADEPAEIPAAAELEQRAVEGGEEFVADAEAELAADAATLESEAAEDDAVGGPAAPPAEEGLIALTTPEELVEFAIPALNATASPDDGSDAPALDESDLAAGFDVRQCPGVDTVVGPATYNGELVVVGIGGGNAYAHTIDGCVEIVRVALP